MRDHLAVVAHWARDQLKNGVDASETRARLRQLITAAEALRTDLDPAPPQAANVINMESYRRSVRG